MESHEIKMLAEQIAQAITPRELPPSPLCSEHAQLVNEIRNINSQQYQLNDTVKKIQSGQEVLISKLVKVEKKIILDKFEEERRKNEELKRALEKKEIKSEKNEIQKAKVKNQNVAHLLAGCGIIATLIGQVIINFDKIKGIFFLTGP